MSCPNCGSKNYDVLGFECGSRVGPSEVLYKSECCKRIAHLRDLLLEALPVVQDGASDLTYSHDGRCKIAGLAKRIENEVRK